MERLQHLKSFLCGLWRFLWADWTCKCEIMKVDVLFRHAILLVSSICYWKQSCQWHSNNELFNRDKSKVD
uniref:Uncharacterized protein n=1 Tax=Solanum tuberosum TaxID=4113 RepID=M1BV54_SOLTU